MNDSKLNTLTVPVAGAENPATLFKADTIPMRVVVRNTGGALLFIAHDSITLLEPSPTAGAFRIPAGSSEVFVLAPKQGIWAAASGAGGLVSIAVSEAIPTERMES